MDEFEFAYLTEEEFKIILNDYWNREDELFDDEDDL